jgi:acid stress chaperone HdeB
MYRRPQPRPVIGLLNIASIFGVFPSTRLRVNERRDNLPRTARSPRRQKSIPMKKLMILTLAAMLSGAIPASAQQLDMSTVKCKDFVASSKENIGLMLMWLQGYYSDEDASPIVDFDKMMKDAQKLGEYCAKNPDHSVITAADEALDD